MTWVTNAFFGTNWNYQMFYLSDRSKLSRGASDNKLNPIFSALINCLTDQNRVNEWVNFPSAAKPHSITDIIALGKHNIMNI